VSVGQEAAARTPKHEPMTDVLVRLELLERRLDALEADLVGGDPLVHFGVELRRLTRELVAAYERVLRHERSSPPHLS
jgi:hypothetical protein